MLKIRTMMQLAALGVIGLVATNVVTGLRTDGTDPPSLGIYPRGGENRRPIELHVTQRPVVAQQTVISYSAGEYRGHDKHVNSLGVWLIVLHVPRGTSVLLYAGQRAEVPFLECQIIDVLSGEILDRKVLDGEGMTVCQATI